MLILFAFSYLEQPIMAISQAMVAATELLKVIDAPLPPTGSLTPDIISKDLIFEDVTFEYPSRPGARVLDGLSFRIQAGQNTALVGPSGSGKSTIVGLLERWYSLKDSPSLPEAATPRSSKEGERDNNDERKHEKSTYEVPIMAPTSLTGALSGSISIGAHDLDDLEGKWWRAQIGLVQQEPFLFNSSIFENVANGLLGTEWENESEAKKREMVQDACQEAYAHEFICRLPDVSLPQVIHIYAAYE